MSQKASPTLIGLFTLIGLLLIGAAIVLFGAGKLFTSQHEVLMHFDKSANGLQIGSDVRFGGVRIGRVKSISVIIDRENNRKIIPVVVELTEQDLRLITANDGGGIDFSTFAGVEKAVAEGLRAGMTQQSLVTGQLYIEFDIVPETPGFTYQGTSRPEHPVVPTIGTQMDDLIAGISDGIEKFNALDLDSVIRELRDVLVNTNQRVKELNLEEINDNLVGITGDIRRITSDEKLVAAVDNLNDAIQRIDRLAAKADEGFDPLLEDLHGVIDRADAGLRNLDEATNEITKLSNPRSPVLLRLQTVLQETERASRALKELSNELKRDPSAILSGRDASE
ncbi:MAG TPA: MlaD family protein [Luteolibacter sp.]|nr:MlaD family protein [Luteolibacter sp.]